MPPDAKRPSRKKPQPNPFKGVKGSASASKGAGATAFVGPSARKSDHSVKKYKATPPAPRKPAPPPVSTAFNRKLGSSMDAAQQGQRVHTAQAYLKQPSPSAERQPSAKAAEKKYRSLPPSKRGSYNASLPPGPAVDRLNYIHEKGRSQFRQHQVSVARHEIANPGNLIGRTPVNAKLTEKELRKRALPLLQQLMKQGNAGKKDTIDQLRDLGVISGTGSKSKTVYDREYRKRLEQEAFLKEKSFPDYTGGTPDRSEILAKFKGRSNAELEAFLKYKPSQGKLVTQGVTGDSLGGIIHGVGNSFAALGDLGGKGTRKVTGSGLAGRAVSDLIQFPGQAVPAAYLAATEPKKLIEGLSQGVVGHLAKGDVKGAKKAFDAHPLFSVAELHGVSSAAGRTTGAVLRGAGKRESRSGLRRAMAAAGDTRRAPIALSNLENTKAYATRHYSKDVFRKAVQVARDKRREAGPTVLTPHGPRPSVQPRKQNALLGRAGITEKGHDQLLHTYADYRSTRATAAGRVARADAARAAQDAKPTRSSNKYIASMERRLPATAAAPAGVRRMPFINKIVPNGLSRPEQDIVSMVQERIIRSKSTFVQDLKTERQRLETYYHDHAKDGDFLPDERAANRERAAAIDAVLRDPKAMGNVDAIFRSAKDLNKDANESSKEAVGSGSMAKEADRRAPLGPAAIAHGGAQYGSQVTKRIQKAAKAARKNVTRVKNEHKANVKQAEGQLKLANRELDAARGASRTLEHMASGSIKAGGYGLELAEGKVKVATEAVAAAKKAEKKAVRTAKAQANAIALKATRTGDQLNIEGRKAPNQILLDRINRDLPDGEKLTRADFAHLPHNLRLAGKPAYHRRFQGARVSYTGGSRRTYGTFNKGASPFSYQHTTDATVGKRVLNAHIAEHDDLLKEIGARHPRGRYFKNMKEAEDFLKRYDNDPRYAGLVPIRAFNSRGSKEAIAKIQEKQEGSTMEDPTGTLADHFAERMMSDKGNGKSATNNVVLVPAEVIERLKEHSVHGSGSPLSHLSAHLFRRTVLPFSAKWFFGNIVEATLRSAMNGVTPLDHNVGRIVFKRMNESDLLGLRALRAEIGGGLVNHVGSTVRTTMEDLAETNPRTARIGEALGRLPIFHETKAVVRTAIEASFKTNRFIEQQYSKAVVGKLARRQMQELTGSWTKALRVQDKAMDQFVKGMNGTPEQIDFLRQFHNVLGQYSNFSPKTRRLIQGYAPFLPWYMNSARFLAVTLPFEHPLKAAVLASAEATFQDDIKDAHEALGKFDKGALASSIPRGDGKWLDIQRYTPFGLTGPIANGDWANAVSAFQPQVSGLVKGASGLDPFGRPLKVVGEDGKQRDTTGGETALYLANQAIESTVPALSMIRRFREHGATATATSTVLSPHTKPGSRHGSAGNRIFNPLRPTYLKDESGGSKTDAERRIDEIVEQASGGGAISSKRIDEIIKKAGGG